MTSLNTELCVNENVRLIANNSDFPMVPSEFVEVLKKREDGVIVSFLDGEAIVHFGTAHSLQVPISLLRKR